jgi:hypothetical protein
MQETQKITGEIVMKLIQVEETDTMTTMTMSHLQELRIAVAHFAMSTTEQPLKLHPDLHPKMTDSRLLVIPVRPLRKQPRG